MAVNVIVLAAGQGTRMNSDRPKVLHPLAGAPLVVHALKAAEPLEPERVVVVVGHGGAEVAKAVQGHLQFLYGADTSGWDLVARYPIHGALPSMRGPLTVAGSGEHGPVLLAGDHCATASIQGAMISGRHAADSACRRLGVVRPDDRRIAV